MKKNHNSHSVITNHHVNYLESSISEVEIKEKHDCGCSFFMRGIIFTFSCQRAQEMGEDWEKL